MARTIAKRNPAKRNDEDKMCDLIASAMNSAELTAQVRAAVRSMAGAASPMDVVIPAVHVEQPEWLAYFGIRPGTGDSVLAQDGYLSGPAFSFEALVEADPNLAVTLSGERKLGMRVRPDKQSILLVIHAGGEHDAAWFEMAGGSERVDAADEFTPDEHKGYV